MEEIKIFSNENFGNVRTIEEDGKILFVASDIAKALGYTNPNKAINDHCRAITKRSTPISGKMQDINYISEGDIYRLVAHSKLESATRFESWVFDEVVPSVRKHGMYATQELLDNPDLLIAVATELKVEREKNKTLTEDVKRMKPKEIFADAVSASDSSMLVRDVAKMIRQNGVPIGEKRFYKWLRENGYICLKSTSPTQKAMELGLFEMVTRTIERGDKLPIETVTTKITGKGQQYFINKFLA